MERKRVTAAATSFVTFDCLFPRRDTGISGRWWPPWLIRKAGRLELYAFCCLHRAVEGIVHVFVFIYSRIRLKVPTAGWCYCAQSGRRLQKCRRKNKSVYYRCRMKLFITHKRQAPTSCDCPVSIYMYSYRQTITWRSERLLWSLFVLEGPAMCPAQSMWLYSIYILGGLLQKKTCLRSPTAPVVSVYMPAQSAAAATTQHTPSLLYIYKMVIKQSPNGILSFFLPCCFQSSHSLKKWSLMIHAYPSSSNSTDHNCPAKNTSFGGITFTKTAVPLRYLRNYMTLSERFSYFFSKKKLLEQLCVVIRSSSQRTVERLFHPLLFSPLSSGVTRSWLDIFRL